MEDPGRKPGIVRVTRCGGAAADLWAGEAGRGLSSREERRISVKIEDFCLFWVDGSGMRSGCSGTRLGIRRLVSSLCIV